MALMDQSAFVWGFDPRNVSPEEFAHVCFAKFGTTALVGARLHESGLFGELLFKSKKDAEFAWTLKWISLGFSVAQVTKRLPAHLRNRLRFAIKTWGVEHSYQAKKIKKASKKRAKKKKNKKSKAHGQQQKQNKPSGNNSSALQPPSSSSSSSSQPRLNGNGSSPAKKQKFANGASTVQEPLTRKKLSASDDKALQRPQLDDDPLEDDVEATVKIKAKSKSKLTTDSAMHASTAMADAVAPPKKPVGDDVEAVLKSNTKSKLQTNYSKHMLASTLIDDVSDPPKKPEPFDFLDSDHDLEMFGDESPLLVTNKGAKDEPAIHSSAGDPYGAAVKTGKKRAAAFANDPELEDSGDFVESDGGEILSHEDPPPSKHISTLSKTKAKKTLPETSDGRQPVLASANKPVQQMNGLNSKQDLAQARLSKQVPDVNTSPPPRKTATKNVQEQIAEIQKLKRVSEHEQEGKGEIKKDTSQELPIPVNFVHGSQDVQVGADSPKTVDLDASSTSVPSMAEPSKMAPTLSSLSSPGNAKTDDQASQKMHAAALPEEVRSLLSLEENKKCAECAVKESTWAVLSYGVFVCTECAEAHKTLAKKLPIPEVVEIATHPWDENNLEKMRTSGNSSSNAKYGGVENYAPCAAEATKDQRLFFLRNKYSRGMWFKPDKSAAEELNAGRGVTEDCTHINCVNPKKVKKVTKRVVDGQPCEGCNPSTGGVFSKLRRRSSVGEIKTCDELTACLDCGYIGCSGDTSCDHARQHRYRARSPNEKTPPERCCISLSISPNENCKIRCWECNAEVAASIWPEELKRAYADLCAARVGFKQFR